MNTKIIASIKTEKLRKNVQETVRIQIFLNFLIQILRHFIYFIADPSPKHAKL